MDFSSIRNQREIKFIESPVIYKFHSEQQSINRISPSQQEISPIGKQLFTKEENKQKPSENYRPNGEKKTLFSQDQKSESKNYEIHIIPESKNSTFGDVPIYSRFYKDDEDIKEAKIQRGIIVERANNNERRSSQELPYYRKYFSPDSLKSSTPPPFPSPYYATQQRYTFSKQSLNEQLTRYAANEVILKTEKQLLQKQVSSLKIQLRTFEQKVQQLNQQKDEWIRCKNRNQILEREYKILNEEFVRLKDNQMEHFENKFRVSEVQKIELKDVSSIHRETHKLEQQIDVLKQKTIKLQEEKQSYISNFKILKKEREKQCKQLKIKQQEIYQSLQKMSKDLSNAKKQKQEIEEENKKLKKKNSQLETQVEMMGKKYSRNSFEDKCRILQVQIQSIHEKHNKKLQKIQNQKEQQRDNLAKKYQQKISSLQNEISDLKDQIRQNLQQIKNNEKEAKSYQKQINQYESKIQSSELKIKQLEQRIKQYQSQSKQAEGKMKENDVLLKNREQELLKKDNELQKLRQKFQQKWRELMEMKQKCLELNETILKHVNQHDILKSENQKIKEELALKQAKSQESSKQHSSQLSSLNLAIATYHQHEAQMSSAHRATIIMKENEIKKQRLDIQGLLQQIVKLRQVKSQNYKLMEKQKELIKVDSAVTHLWAVKQTQYQNIVQILNAINCGRIVSNQ